MSLDDLYALLLNHEMRIEQKRGKPVLMFYTIYLQILLRKIKDCLKLVLELKEVIKP